MKILCFSDLHCHSYEQFSTRLSDGRNSRLADCLSIIEQARQISIAKEVDACVFLGDCFHSRHRIDTDVYTLTYEAFHDLAQHCKQLYMLVGNHDQSTLIGDQHALIPFREFAEVIDFPRYDKYLKSYLCPHLPGDKFKEAMFKCPWGNNAIFIHQGISEGFVGPYNRTVKSAVAVADLPIDKAFWILAGDYHKRQFFGPGNKIHYIGSPLQLNFGERDEEKAFSLLDTKTGKIETIPTEAPRFFVSEEAKPPKEANLSRDFVRLIVKKKELKKAEELKEQYPNNIQIQLVDETSTLSHSSCSFTNSAHDMIRDYVSKQNKSLDPEELIELGTAIMGEANI